MFGLLAWRIGKLNLFKKFYNLFRVNQYQLNVDADYIFPAFHTNILIILLFIRKFFENKKCNVFGGIIFTSVLWEHQQAQATHANKFILIKLN